MINLKELKVKVVEDQINVFNVLFDDGLITGAEYNESCAKWRAGLEALTYDQFVEILAENSDVEKLVMSNHIVTTYLLMNKW